MFVPNGDIHNCVPTHAAAHTVQFTDLLRPSWLLRCPDGLVSDANYCSDNWEIQYDPTPTPALPQGETPTPEQTASIKYAIQEYYALYGATPIIGHGVLQSDKWRTEPHALGYAAIGLTEYIPNVGYIYEEALPIMNPAPDAQIKRDLESFGVGINPDTAIMRFAYDAYRSGDPPLGNWRGPARFAPAGPQSPGQELPGIGEYTVVKNTPTGQQVFIRHRFTAGIIEYNPQTGGIGWMELVNHPEAIDEI